MKFEKIEQSRVKASFTCTKEEFVSALDKAFEIDNAEVTIPGYRKGKASRSVFEKKFGVESLFATALDVVVNNVLEKDVFTSKDFVIVGRPSLDVDYAKISVDSGFDFTLTFDVAPEVKLGDYKGITVKKEDLNVTDKEVEDEINNQLASKAEVKVKAKGKLANGDIAIFDFVGSVDGVEFPGGAAENYELKIGSGQFIPGFEDQMVGMAANSEKDVNVTFPEVYQEESLAGKPAVFKVKLHEIKETVYPKLSDELVVELAVEGVSNVADYKAHVLETLKTRKEAADKQRVQGEAVEAVIKNATIDVPQTYIDRQVQQIKGNVERQAKQYNIPFEMFLQFSGMTVESFEENAKGQALNDVKFDLILEEIAKVEKFEVSEEEFNNSLEAYAKAYNMTAAQVEKQIGKANVEFSIKSKKAYDLIIDNIKLK